MNKQRRLRYENLKTGEVRYFDDWTCELIALFAQGNCRCECEVEDAEATQEN